MSGTAIAFAALAVVAIGAGWRVFVTDSMVRASFLLLLSFVSVGLIMLLLSAAYIGFATIFMMAVEMLVMAVFMVMFMMNPAGLNPMSMVHQKRAAVAAGVVVFAGLEAVILLTDYPDRPVAAGADVVAALGTELLGNSMLVFETAGVTLLAAMLATVVLSSRNGRYGPSDDGSKPPALVPGGRPAGASDEPQAAEADGGRGADDSGDVSGGGP